VAAVPDEPVRAGQYKIRRNDDGSYRVINTVSGKVHGHHETEDNAKHQRQLLYAVGHGWKPTEES
jgi:hypothetical protein